MQNLYTCLTLLGKWLFRAKNIYILSIGCLILAGQYFWLWKPDQLTKENYAENTDWQILKGLEMEEECVNLQPGQKLEYSFKSSAELAFNIHFHEQGHPIYMQDDKATVFKKGVLIPPKKDEFCLMWVNLGMEDIRLSYNTQLLSQHKNQEIKRIPVRYSVSPDKQAIRIVSDSGKELSKFEIGANILNFALNNNSTVLAVSVSDLKETLLIYDVNSHQIITKIAIRMFPRLLAFSADNRFLIVGDEHIAKIIRIDLKNSRQDSLTLPLLPLALLTGEEPGELLVRAEREVMKIHLDPLKLIERNARIEFTFGEETFLADPDEFCTAHGVPHPLFTPSEEAMSTEGIQGYYLQSK
jgi:hypothetical protein